MNVVLRRVRSPADDTALGRDPALAVRQLALLLAEYLVSAAPPRAPTTPRAPPSPR
ncbi:MAG TPA: hypothetical protein VGD56_14080 [Gemmatirosa sp.]